ncbi:Receptor-like protein kinase-related family protein [Tripterygium wilfordii]|uniref:Receptor-like protein kinase-related family protein n=1 Tax=Tripterygium wilfordii TaxID=458696 RepID=A0A7J7DI64_TRIWF|nr:cysteine-rich repeat secretory protein 38-like [Tripterygium wilfordii]KAF5746041.1 Receptor-like protein kinase-related family protein [Tripterygium wilfordii]
MSPSPSLLSFYLLSFALALQSVFGLDPLFYTCSKSNNFTANGPYESNLNNLMGYLYLKSPSTGFGNGSIGQEPNQVYGLALCRGDASASDCKSCIAQASYDGRQRCPDNRGAAIWYDYCQLKYSDQDFFGQIDDEIKYILYNTQNVSDPLAFNQGTRTLLTNLAEEASLTPKMYSEGEVEFGLEKIYGLAQCTRDLSSYDCKKCLTDIIGEIPSCCDGKKGGRVVTGSCNIRYEMYPFVNA